MKFKKTLIALSLVLVLFVPVLSRAASILGPDIIAAAACAKGGPCTLNTFISLGVSIANFILGIVGALTLLMFIYGGFMWILSGGSSDKVQKGKDIILGSVVGLLIVFSSYLIISFVSNTLLGKVESFTGQAPSDSANNTTTAANTCSSNYQASCVDGATCPQDKPQRLTGTFKDCKGDNKICCYKPLDMTSNSCSNGYHCVLKGACRKGIVDKDGCIPGMEDCCKE